MARRHEPDGSRLVRRFFTGMVEGARVDDGVSSVQPDRETPHGGDVGDLAGEIVGPHFRHGAVGGGGGADADGVWEGCGTRWTLAHAATSLLDARNETHCRRQLQGERRIAGRGCPGVG